MSPECSSFTGALNPWKLTIWSGLMLRTDMLYRVSSWSTSANGSLTLLQSFLFTLNQTGPNPARQEAPHPHEVILDPTGSYVAVPDLGADLVRIFHIDNTTSLLTPQTPGMSRHTSISPVNTH